MNIPGTHRMDREDEEIMDIYANADPVNSLDVRTENSYTERHQTLQHTGDEAPFIIKHILVI